MQRPPAEQRLSSHQPRQPSITSSHASPTPEYGHQHTSTTATQRLRGEARGYSVLGEELAVAAELVVDAGRAKQAPKERLG